MIEPKEIANYYLERYRKVIGFANVALSSALLVLLVNWLFSVEPGFQTILSDRKTYKDQIHKVRQKIKESNEAYYAYYNTANEKYKNYIFNLKVSDTLLSKLEQEKKTNAQKKHLEDSLKIRNAEIEEWRTDSTKRAKDKVLNDSLDRIKYAREKSEKSKGHPLAEATDKYDWQSLIHFIFIVAGDPKEGCLYLMGGIVVLLMFVFVCRKIAMHYLVKSLRVFKSEESLGLNIYKDMCIPTPFWLAHYFTKEKKKTENASITHITREELLEVLGFKNNRSKYIFINYILLLGLILLQFRLFYICLHANTPLHFDLVFAVGTIMCLLTVSQTYLLALPGDISGRFNNEPAGTDLGRRVFIATSASAVIAYFLFRDKNKIAGLYGLNAKRFRKNKKSNFIRSEHYHGLYVLNVKPKNKWQKKQAFFFNEKKTTINLKKFKDNEEKNQFFKALVELNEKESLDPNLFQFKKGTFSWQVENYTLHLLKKGKIDEAGVFLFNQIKHAKSDVSSIIRLADLAAKIFIRRKDDLAMFRDFQDFVAQYRDSGYYLRDERALDKRITKWNNQKWVNKIKKQKYILYNEVRF